MRFPYIPSPFLPVAINEAKSTNQLLYALWAKIKELEELIAALGLKPISEWVAPAFDISQSYTAGEFVTKDGLFYIALENVSPGVWNSAQWEEVTISEILLDQKEEIGNVADDAATAQDTAEKAYGKAGTFTIAVSDWNPTTQTYTKSIEGLKANDAILLAPATTLDRDNMQGKGLFLSAASAGSITISYDIIPTQSLTIDYFIMRGD